MATPPPTRYGAEESLSGSRLPPNAASSGDAPSVRRSKFYICRKIAEDHISKGESERGGAGAPEAQGAGYPLRSPGSSGRLDRFEVMGVFVCQINDADFLLTRKVFGFPQIKTNFVSLN